MNSHVTATVAPAIADAGLIRLGATFRLPAIAAVADTGRIKLGATFRLAA